MITTAPFRSYQDGKEGRSILVCDQVPDRVTTRWQREITWPIFSG